MKLYHSIGHSYLVCPRLLEMDKRHGEHWSKWHLCRRGQKCIHNHNHEEELIDTEGHTVNDFYWVPGCRPPTENEHPVCGCGLKLIHADLDNLYDPKHLVETKIIQKGGKNNAQIQHLNRNAPREQRSRR